MPTYITLANYTQQGMANIKQSPSRLDAARQALQPLGVDITAFYLTMGRYDFVAVVEAPDDEAAAKTLLALGAQGNIRTETLRAFAEDEFRQIVDALP